MRFDVVSLFPDFFEPLRHSGVSRRAFSDAGVDLRLWNPRDHADGGYRRVDDRPFGGGPGMVMMAEPLARCVQAVQADRAASAPVVLFSPIGERLCHDSVAHWARSEGAILICGRYEGIDQRFIDRVVTHQLSLGDFILSGGEIAAMAFLDAVARLQPGVLHDAESSVQDSFHPALDGLLDCPHFTRPEVWDGDSVPEVLLSGHHARIDAWRRAQRLRLTWIHRPDLIDRARAQGRLSAGDEQWLASLGDSPSGPSF